MARYIYDIIMQTQIGDKKGMLTLQVLDKKIEGLLDLLGRREPCYGKLTAPGECELYGRMKTPMREFDYTATGSFNSEEIRLTLSGGRDVFQVVGSACRQIPPE